MDLREKRKLEVENQKNQRKEEVIFAALEVFKEHGIENTKVVDIAKKAEIGVASVYRYFKTKPDLVIEAACKFWQDEISGLYNYYLEEDFSNKDGLTKVKDLLDVYLKLYHGHQEFIQFIDEFDRYVVKEKIPKENLSTYEKSIINLKPIFITALENGKKDGTIRTDLESEKFYFSINHALMSMCERLVLRGNVLESDYYVQGEDQIKMIIDSALSYIKQKKE